MPQIDQLADGGALRADDDIPIERSAGTRKAHGYPMDPPTVSDTGTDTYAGNFGRDVNDRDLIVGDFGPANTTTTPTLENTGGTPDGAKNITLKDGEPVWINAIQGKHVLQYASGTDTWLLIDPRWIVAPFWAGDIDGLELSNNGTDADHDIDIATGVCSMRDGSGNRKLFELTSGLTKQIDANWAEGTAAGGFPSGLTLSADTWYHVFVIGKDDGTVDAGFDTSTSAANLLTDASTYSWFRRIGSVLTDGTSNIIGFQQSGDRFWWDSVVKDINVSNPGTSATNRTMSVPPDFKVRWIGHGHIFDDTCTASSAGIVSDPDSTDVAPVAGGEGQIQVGADDANGGDIFGASYLEIMTNTSSQIRSHLSASDADISLRLLTEGWIDPRGRNQ